MRHICGKYDDPEVKRNHAYFNDAQRQATKDSAVLSPVSLSSVSSASPPPLPSPTVLTRKAASPRPSSTISVEELSTFRSCSSTTVTSRSRLPLVGEDFDNHVIEHSTHEYKREAGTDVAKNQRALPELKEVEKVKRTLFIPDVHQARGRIV
ncbi:70-kilodalton heat shock protein [Ceratobasidium sp. 394]|nr:70-kilodalton heat shock protein [Ceratobasidium sp. 394]